MPLRFTPFIPRSLADAEVGEDVVEDGVAGDLAASDFAERTDREAKDDWAI